ncbi:MAG: hypothetical protein ACPGQL_09790 [Thermoplasmatota archaeon]
MHWSKPALFRLLTVLAAFVGLLLPGGPGVTMVAAMVVGALATQTVRPGGASRLKSTASGSW